MSAAAVPVSAETPLMPQTLISEARAAGCEQVEDFFTRPGMIKPPYVYGYLPGREDRSVVYWCEHRENGQRQFWLMVTTPPEERRCPERINWPNYPGGLTIERGKKVKPERFVYVSEWGQPKRKIPKSARFGSVGIQTEYDGVGARFYCYKGEWGVQLFH